VTWVSLARRKAEGPLKKASQNMKSRAHHYDIISFSGSCSQVLPRANAEKPVLFLFPGLSGDLRELASLRASCSVVIQVVQIAFPDWPEMHRRAIGLDALVEHCLRQIVVSPGGPTLLAGYSYGGHIAYAVALALESVGRPVRLGLLDTQVVPDIVVSRPHSAARLERLIAAVWRGELGLRLTQIAANAMIRLRYKWPFQISANWRIPGEGNSFDLWLRTGLHLQVLLELLQRLPEQKPLVAEVCLFRSTDRISDTSHDLGWSRYCRNLMTVPIPGNHFGISDPAVMPILSQRFIEAMVNGRTERRFVSSPPCR
jgi:thioesterase domain-containing protein